MSFKMYNTDSYATVGLDRPLGLQEIEVLNISRKPAHECGKVFQT
jgi:hypothetical protein